MLKIELFKELLKNWYFRLLVIFSLVVVPLFLSWFVSKDNFLWFNLSTSNDWIGFLGSYVGGIIGGLFTLLGVLLTLKKQNEQDSKLEVKQKEQDKKIATFQFEDTLFRLMGLQNDSISQIKIETLRNEWVEGKQTFEWIIKESKQVIEEIIDEDYKQFNIRIDKDLEFQIITSAFRELYYKFEDTFAHYFRNITYIIKSISTVEDSHLRENYLSILKAQLTQSELQVIFYFVISSKDLETTYKLLVSTDFFNTSIKGLLFENYHFEFFQNLEDYQVKEIDEISLFLDNENLLPNPDEEEFLRGIE
ncbi:putative phage abortive infection protein [Heyndrickxia sporothermodurans]|uniref:putative phage abortive infection protein n=1 Tax=Heyndrickxia sporothermodurans TaxID=46224 RepID=UPI002E21506E|nr:putative phage abortive infection protein [Heyndrickxia sporothermodurans]